MTRGKTLWVLLALLLARQAAAQSLVVIVNPASGVHSLTRNQALDIFLGRFRKLPSGMAALPLDLGPNSPERSEFYMLIAHKNSSDMNSYWARLVFSAQASPPFQAANARAAVDLVATNPNAIAYVDRAAVDNRVRVVLELKP